MRNRFSVLCASALLIVLSILLSASAQGQNNRSAVSLTGSDAATCTVPDPCRTFGVAMSKTNDSGEVIVLSSAGYGPFTVTKSVSIISPLAFHAAMAPTSGTAITVNAPGATVILKGLYLNSLGAATGVSVSSAFVVHIENLVVNGFQGNGIEVVGSAEVFVKDSEIRDNTASGIFASAAPNLAILSVDGVRVERNAFGIAADSGVRLTARNVVAARNFQHNFWFRNGGTGATLQATVEDSVATDGSGAFVGAAFVGGGFLVQDGAHVTIRNSVAARNDPDGFHVFASTMGTTTELVLDQCLATENSQGILAGAGGSGTGLITVSNSTATNNTANGIVAGTNGVVRAFGNTVTRNGTGLNGQNGAFRSGGHNFVDGNTTETLGTITPIAPM